MDWKAVAEKIIQDDRNKWDRKVSGKELQVTESGELLLLNGQREMPAFLLSEIATLQLCQKLEIPVKYFRRLPDEMKATVANFDIGRLNGNSYLLRGKGEWIRAFLSAEYVAYNNSEIAQTAESLLRNGALSVKSFVLEESHMFLKILSEDIVDREVGLKAGIMIGNSEVGMGSVSVEPFVFRKPCTNDLIVRQEKSFRHAHIHLTEYEMTRRMAEAVGEGFRVASSVMDAFLKTREEPIEDPLATIGKSAGVGKSPQKLRGGGVPVYWRGPERSRFGVINAFTS